jgi:hypothetical protein
MEDACIFSKVVISIFVVSPWFIWFPVLSHVPNTSTFLRTPVVYSGLALFEDDWGDPNKFVDLSDEGALCFERRSQSV